MKDAIDVLQQYGGWACTVFLAIAILRFYKDFKVTVKDKDDQIKDLNENHHKEMVEVVRECTGVLATVNQALGHCRQQAGRHGNEG